MDSTDANNFSEDEEAIYVAEHDSDTDQEPGAPPQGPDFQLGNVAVFRNTPKTHHPDTVDYPKPDLSVSKPSPSLPPLPSFCIYNPLKLTSF